MVKLTKLTNLHIAGTACKKTIQRKQSEKRTLLFGLTAQSSQINATYEEATKSHKPQRLGTSVLEGEESTDLPKHNPNGIH